MKKFLLNILKEVGNQAKDTALGMLPGSGIVIEGITKLFDKDNANNNEGLVEIEEGVTQALQALGSDHVNDAALLASGITELKQAFEKIKSALKK